VLSGALVQVKFSRDLIIPRYVNALDPKLQEDAATLISLVTASVGSTRGELDLALLEAFGEEPGQFVRRGLLKMIDDCCEWSVESAHAPDEVRTAVFAAAFAARVAGTFDRTIVLAEVGQQLGLAADQVDDALFADLKSEQRLKSVEAMTPVQLLER
jgi:predicted nuclease of restriction endonuclease-like RecB superfamily